MRDFTNEKVSKEYSKLKNMLFAGIILIVLANVIVGWAVMQKPEKLHDLILDGGKENQSGELELTDISDYFAYYPGDTNRFYFAADEDYIYVIRMRPSTYQKIENELKANKVATVDGATKKTPSDIREIAIEVYNEILEEDEQLTIADFENYFGAIYLDLEASPIGFNEVIIVIMLVCALCGLGFALAGGIGTWRFKRKINKLTAEEREAIDREMNHPEAFYYANAHLYLTDNYIINFASTFDAITYKDVIWAYQFIQRRNGIKVSQSIVVMTKNGKSHTIASLNGLTKKAKDVFDEIFETVAKKSTNAVIGYTSENRKKAKEKIEK